MTEENVVVPEAEESEKTTETEFHNKAVDYLKRKEPETPVVVQQVAPMPLTPPEKNATGPYIKYNGIGTVRNITAAEWKSAGVRDQNDVQWNYLNGYKIPVSKLSESAVKYCLERDGRFTKVD